MADLLSNDICILKDFTPTIGVVDSADSIVNFAVLPCVKAADDRNVYFDLTENIKKHFDAEKISIFFPRRDVNVYELRMNKY